MAESSLDEQLTKRESEGGSYARHVEHLRAEIHELRRVNAKLQNRNGSHKRASPRTHMQIGDAHSDPEVSNDRFTWLGRMASDLRPEVMVSMGDWGDLGSLCSYEKGKRSFEGRRYHKDIDHANDAIEKLENQIGKARGYSPRKIAIRGNHDGQRIERATDETPALDGLISPDDIKFKEAGWEVYDFLVPATVDGITYIHYAPSGVMTRPIGGMNHAANLIRLCLTSTVVGHAHTYDYAERTGLDGKKMLGLSVGCFFEHHMPWAGPANALYARGISMLTDVADGFGSVSWTPLETMKKRYA